MVGFLKNKFTRYLIIIVCIFVLLMSVFFINNKSSKVLGEDEVPYTLLGWIWSQGYGWISLNSNNCKNKTECTCDGIPCATPRIDYSVSLSTTTNEIYGWGWSSNVGWVCFGDGNNNKNGVVSNGCTSTPPDRSPLKAEFDEITGKISGWAQVLSLGNNGWIHLASSSPNFPLTSSYMPVCYNCQAYCDRWSVTGTLSDITTTTPCLQESTSTFSNCKICFSQTKLSANIIPYPGVDQSISEAANFPDPNIDSVAGGSGLICENCQVCMKPDPSSDRIACSNQCLGSCKDYGTFVDLQSGSLAGWGWSGFKQSADSAFYGAGWIHFNIIAGGGAKILAPWLETKFGQLFSQKDIRQWAGSGQENATYCIYAKNIYGIKTKSISCPKNPIEDVDIKSLKTTTTQNVYRNALGKIDLFGLTTSTKVISGVEYNKYGNQIVKDLNLLSDANGLGNKVFIIDRDATVDAVQIKNGSATSKYGNGTVVVNGDLTINGNITYSDSAGINDVKKLASIAWIVKGDLIIKETVTSTVGAFIVLGDGISACKYDNGDNCNDATIYPRYLKNGYGTVFSGSSEANLTVNGLIVARAYDFRRRFTNIDKGSETIIYDGRLIANPPPGFTSFVEGFPVIRDFEYTN